KIRLHAYLAVPMAKESFRIDRSGLMFVAGLVIVTIVMILLTWALGVSPGPDMSMPFPSTHDEWTSGGFRWRLLSTPRPRSGTIRAMRHRIAREKPHCGREVLAFQGGQLWHG